MTLLVSLKLAGLRPRFHARPSSEKISAMAEGRSTREKAHDVLAAEEFAMPAADPDLHHGPVLLPEDPTGDPIPHDVLAAEEFPMPAPRHGDSSGGSFAGSVTSSKTLARVAIAGGAILLLRRLFRR